MPARKSQKRSETDERIKKALIELTINKSRSIRAVAREYNVDHATLSRRSKGGKSIAESRESQQILTIPEENALAECITRLSVVGHPPKQSFIRELAEEIRINRLHSQTILGDLPPFLPAIGDSWVQRFIHRHPHLETTYIRTIEAVRVQVATAEAFDTWFKELRKTIEEKNIRTEDIYNMNETEFSIGAIKGSYVVVNKTSNIRHQAHLGRQE